MRKHSKKLFSAVCAGATLVGASGAEAVTLDFREGLNGYSGTEDTWFSSRFNGEVDGFPDQTYIRTALWNNFDPNQQGMLKFNNVFGSGASLVPQGSTINSATLTMHVPSDITYADGEPNEVYQMLMDWVETDAHGFGANPGPWAGGATGGVDRDAIEAATTPVADSTAFASGNVIPLDTTITFDVTSVVQNWSANAGTNFGFMFQSVEDPGNPGVGLDGGGGLFMASSEYGGADGEVARPTLSIDFTSAIPTVASIRVNTTTGRVTLHNDTGGDISAVDYYKIISPNDSLDASGWNSLEQQDLAAFPAGTGVGDGWEELGTASSESLAEGYLQGSSLLADGSAISLGDIFSVGGDQDLEFLYRTSDAFTGGIVDYVTAVLGDMNDDGVVDTADVNPFVQALTDRAAFDAANPTVNADVVGDVNDDGSFNFGDIVAFRAAVNAPGESSSSAVPEPSTILLLGIGFVGFAIRSRKTSR